jgi:hypothetical protein
MTDVVRALTAEELAAELEESRKRRAVQDAKSRAEVFATGRRYTSEDAAALDMRPPPMSDGSPFVLYKMTSHAPPKRKKKK